MSKEQWRDVKGLEGKYEVSTMGRVRVKPKIIGGWLGANGYIYVSLPKTLVRIGASTGKHTSGQKCLVHRLVAEAFIGTRPSRLDVNHKNSDRTDNRRENLEYVTRQENMRHAWRNGRMKGCTTSHKLSVEQIASIHTDFAGGMSQRQIAIRLKVSAGTISWHLRRERVSG